MQDLKENLASILQTTLATKSFPIHQMPNLSTISPQYSGRDVTNQVISIWFIHGLTGNRKKTWTHEKGTFWPRDLLAKDFPRARIIIYGYDADVVKFAHKWGNASSEDLTSYGQGLAFAIRDSRRDTAGVPTSRPIYFIPHSLGGLVVEQALLHCIGADPSLHAIADASAGILFMGTPHEGAHLAKWGSTLRSLIPDRFRKVNGNILNVLRTDSILCKRLEESFQKRRKMEGSSTSNYSHSTKPLLCVD